MADFTGNGIDDLAVLTPIGVSIYLGNGKGGFVPPTTYAVPAESDGLTVADLDRQRQARPARRRCLRRRPGLAGQRRRHVPALPRGQPVDRAGRRRPHRQRLEGHHLRRPGPRSRGRRLWRGQFDRAGQSIHRPARPRGLQLATWTAPASPDLIVANSGSNNVLIYPGLGNGQFGPAVNGGKRLLRRHQSGGNHGGQPHRRHCPTWSSPTRAPTRSRSCSIRHRGTISFSAGPRLEFRRHRGRSRRSSATSPAAPIPDILVTNSGSNDVTLLRASAAASSTTRTRVAYTVGIDPVTELRRQLRRQYRPADRQRRLERPDADLRTSTAQIP